jgi:hypothetical protein
MGGCRITGRLLAASLPQYMNEQVFVSRPVCMGNGGSGTRRSAVSLVDRWVIAGTLGVDRFDLNIKGHDAVIPC